MHIRINIGIHISPKDIHQKRVSNYREVISFNKGKRDTCFHVSVPLNLNIRTRLISSLLGKNLQQLLKEGVYPLNVTVLKITWVGVGVG